jgi:saccharopine dehydrogenase-like NADP-dependent oxidoreductase
MRVVVLGGSGAFGSLLCKRLTADGHLVWVAGRSWKKADAVAAKIGAEVLVMDRTAELSPLFALKPQVLVDAAGPFQSYGEAPYRLAEACIEHGVNYLDLADDPRFVAGMARLDAKAKDKGVWALSGASTVPGLSSVIAAQLTRDLDRCHVIEGAILPGNRAPRGASTMRAFLAVLAVPRRFGAVELGGR